MCRARNRIGVLHTAPDRFVRSFRLQKTGSTERPCLHTLHVSGRKQRILRDHSWTHLISRRPDQRRTPRTEDWFRKTGMFPRNSGGVWAHDSADSEQCLLKATCCWFCMPCLRTANQTGSGGCSGGLHPETGVLWAGLTEQRRLMSICGRTANESNNWKSENIRPLLQTTISPCCPT